MPFVDGPTIEQKIRLDGAMSPRDALEIACEVADALEHAHAQGFVHRDIKPSNILLAHGHAVVADFGVARTVEAVERTEPHAHRHCSRHGRLHESRAGRRRRSRRAQRHLRPRLRALRNDLRSPALHRRHAARTDGKALERAGAAADDATRSGTTIGRRARPQSAFKIGERPLPNCRRAQRRYSKSELGRAIGLGGIPPEQDAPFSSGPKPASVLSSETVVDPDDTRLQTALISAEIGPAATNRSGEATVIAPPRRRRGRYVVLSLLILAVAAAGWKLRAPRPENSTAIV